MSPVARWERLEGAPPPRRAAQVVSTPVGVFVVGGVDDAGPRDDAWHWNGVRWQALPRDGAPVGRTGAAAVWVGDALCVWGGRAPRAPTDTGACWSPSRARWTPMSHDGAPSPRADAAAAWDGHAMLVFGGRDGEGEALADAFAYDPRDDRWRAWRAGPLGRWGATLHARDDGRVVLAGGAGEPVALGADEAAVCGSFVWRTISAEGAPLLREGPWQAVVGGSVLRVTSSATSWLDPDASRWVSRATLPLGARVDASMAAVPGGAVIYGGRDGDRALGDGARYVLADDRWETLPTEGAPPPRRDAALAWDGRRLLVLWGDGPDGLRDDVWALVWPDR